MYLLWPVHGNNNKTNDAKYIRQVQDNNTHWNKPCFVFPLTGNEYNQK
jgi:hypothetical protein